jgi:hypothetical protein
MDELSREVLKHFIAMGAESLDLLIVPIGNIELNENMEFASP